MNHIVKRKGHTENFDDRKVYASVYRACLTLRMDVGAAELIADKVTKAVVEAIEDEESVTVGRIAYLTASNLSQYSEDAAYLYTMHRSVS